MTTDAVVALPQLPGGGRIVHVVAEYWPYARTGGLAEAVRGLGEHQVWAGLPVSVIMPLHSSVRDHGTDLEPVGGPFTVTIGAGRHEVRLFHDQGHEVNPDVYFVDQPEFFHRAGVYGDGTGDYPDNLERFACFCLAALRGLSRVAPDARVLHLHDWHTAVTAIFRDTHFGSSRFHTRLGMLMTVHNAAFQGWCESEALSRLGIPERLFDWRVLEWYGKVNLLKGGLVFSDAATTVSPTHAAELRTSQGGFGLHEHFASMGDRLVGILNGIDTMLWNPATDPLITARYSSHDVGPKARCKEALQRTYGLPRRRRTPLIVMSARLVEQKGLDLILAPGILWDSDAQYVFLGRGEPRYEAALAELARQAPDRIAVPLAFSERLEHRLLAGADMLLMPSRFEPCGLTQMRAQRYGTLPIVRRVGGLADTVVDEETGFVFEAYEPDALRGAIHRAVAAYRDMTGWQERVRAAMRREFGWGPSATRYQGLYLAALRAAARRPAD